MSRLTVGEKPHERVEVEFAELNLQVVTPLPPPDAFATFHVPQFIQPKNRFGARYGVLVSPSLILPDTLKLYLGVAEQDSHVGGLLFIFDFF